MALIFPSNPTLNQVFSTGSLSWTWNGKSWNNGTSILVTSNLVSSSVQFTNGNTNAFDTTSNITVGQITASFAKISGSIFGTASFAILAQTSSYLENSQTASYVVLAQTASYVLNSVSASYSLTASYVALAQTASYVENAQTASYVTLSQTASYVTLSQTASYVALAQTASYISTASYALAALSASYAPNIYVLPSNVVSASAQLSNGGGVAFDTNSNITVNQITASFAKITNLTVEYVTSSVMVITGSNKFGDASNDKQEFTGSVSISGSLSVVGNVTSNNVLSLASGTVSLPSLILSTDTTSGMYRIGANNIGVAISAAKVLDISSTGLSVTGALSASGGYNGSVGATTPSTVAATTMTTTGNVTIGTTGATNFIFGDFSSALPNRLAFKTTTTNGGTFLGVIPDGSSTLGGINIFGLSDVTTNTFRLGLTADSSSAAKINALATGTATVRNLQLQVQSTTIGEFSSTGLAVTGALSASGTLSTTSAASFSGAGLPYAANSLMLRNNGTGDSQLWALGPNTSTNGTMTIVTADSDGSATATVGVFSSNGLAVTGALSCTTPSTLCSTSGVLTVGSNTATAGGIIVNTSGTVGNMAYLNFKSAGTQCALFGLTGAALGTTATDALIFAETGKSINLWPNGGTTGVIINASGNVGIGTTSPSQLLTFGNATAGLGVGWGDTTGNYANIFAPYSASGLVLATGFQGSRSSDAYTSSYGGSAMYRSGIRLNAFGNGNIQFFTDGSSTVASGTAFTPTERMRITDAGNVGIGTTSPVEKVYVSDGLNEFGINPTTLASPFSAVNGTSLDFRFTANGNTNARFAAMVGVLDAGSAGNNSGHLEFWTAPTGSGNPAIVERMRILASGNVGIGTTSPAVRLHVNGGSGVIVSDSSLTASQVVIGVSTLTSGRPFIGTNTNTNPLEIGTRDAQALIFVTNSTERARIDSSGNVGIGTTSVGIANNIGTTIESSGLDNARITVNHSSAGSSNGSYYMQFGYGGSLIGSISQSTTTAVAYNTTSDYRLKEITGLLTDSGAFIDGLKPKVGTWKADGSRFVGFLAHEFAEVSPSSVTGQKDAVDSDGNPVYQAMQASSAEVIANLVAELQSLRQRVAALESK